jgi:hypothetical protein
MQQVSANKYASGLMLERKTKRTEAVFKRGKMIVKIPWDLRDIRVHIIYAGALSALMQDRLLDRAAQPYEAQI